MKEGAALPLPTFYITRGNEYPQLIPQIQLWLTTTG